MEDILNDNNCDTIKDQILKLNLENKIDLSSICCFSQETLDKLNLRAYEKLYSSPLKNLLKE